MAILPIITGTELCAEFFELAALAWRSLKFQSLAADLIGLKKRILISDPIDQVRPAERLFQALTMKLRLLT